MNTGVNRMIITNRTSMHTKPSAHKGKDQAARNQTCFLISTPLSLGFAMEGGGEGRCLTPFCCIRFFFLLPPFGPLPSVSITTIYAQKLSLHMWPVKTVVYRLWHHTESFKVPGFVGA